MQLYRDDGIVLRTQKLGEADRIITILGRTSGRIRAVAKGVRRTKSRFGARLEPVPIPWDCRDGNFPSYWRRPEAYLDERVRRPVSVWQRRRCMCRCASTDTIARRT